MSLVSSASPVGGRGDASTDSGSENAASPPNSNSGNQYPCVTARLLTPAQPGGRGSPPPFPPGPPAAGGGGAKDRAPATSSTTGGSSTAACLGWGGEPMYARARTTSGDAA